MTTNIKLASCPQKKYQDAFTAVFYRSCVRKLSILIALLLLINTVSFSASKIDTAKSISNYKADSAKAQTKIDSLEKKAKTDDTTKPAVLYENGFLISISIIGLICVVICGFLIYISTTCPKDCKYALGLPDGTVRALIALFVIVFYILISLAFSLFSKDSTIATDVTKTLGTLVVAVSSFYFGSKTAEQGVKNAAAMAGALKNRGGNQNDGQAQAANGV